MSCLPWVIMTYLRGSQCFEAIMTGLVRSQIFSFRRPSDYFAEIWIILGVTLSQKVCNDYTWGQL